VGLFGFQTGPDTLPRWVDFAIANAAALFVLHRLWFSNDISATRFFVISAVVIAFGNGLTVLLTRHKRKNVVLEDGEQTGQRPD